MHDALSFKSDTDYVTVQSLRLSRRAVLLQRHVPQPRLFRNLFSPTAMGKMWACGQQE